MLVMVAAVNAREGDLCVVYKTERTGIRVLTTSYCGVAVSAGDGVMQVATKSITCGDCKRAIKETYGEDL